MTALDIRVSSAVQLDVRVISSEVVLSIQIGGVSVTNTDPTQGKAAAASSISGAQRLVYVRADGKLALADASTEGKETLAFVSGDHAPGDEVTYHTSGRVTGLSGLVPGARYFMTTTPGVLGAAPDGSVGSGLVVQQVGTAVSATELAFSTSLPITL